MCYACHPPSLVAICIECRKTAKTVSRFGLHSEPRCPGCRQPMKVQRASFRTPKRRDTKAWEAIREDQRIHEAQEIESNRRRQRLGETLRYY